MKVNVKSVKRQSQRLLDHFADLHFFVHLATLISSEIQISVFPSNCGIKSQTEEKTRTQ